MRINFNEVKMSSSCQGKCTVCGRKRKRSFTVAHTVNPYNKKDDGTPKTREEVTADVSFRLSEKIAFMKKNFICRTCQDRREDERRKTWG